MGKREYHEAYTESTSLVHGCEFQLDPTQCVPNSVLFFQSPFNTSSIAGPQAVFTSFKLPKPGPPAPEFTPSPLGAQTREPFGFSLGSLRPPMPHFTTTTQFQTKTELEPPMSLGGGAIRHGGEAAKKELCESPTAPNVQEDVQKIQENNNNNQSETEETHSDEVTPPKNQGLIKVMSKISHESRDLLRLFSIVGSWNIFPPDGLPDPHAPGLGYEGLPSPGW